MALKILLIEDNSDHIEITKRILRKASEDYQLDFAMDSREGLKMIFEGSYDAVLCDYRLPDSTALDVLKEINNKNKKVPFIVVTALGNEKVAVDMMKEGAYDYIVKDVLYSDTLDMVIKKAIDRYRIRKEKDRLEKEIVMAYKELKETQNQLIQAEKLNAVGQLASGVAHEVRNPLAIILQGVNYLEKKVPASDKNIFETLSLIKDSIVRADTIIRTLVDFSRVTKLDAGPEDINKILENSLVMIQYRFKLENVKIVKDMKNDLPKVSVDKRKMEQVFVNIFLNAVQAMHNGGELFIRSYLKELDTHGEKVGKRERDYFSIGEKAVVVEVEDTGIGIPKEHMGKIFDPFFTTKDPQHGTGLGLSVTRNIIYMHKGLIEIESREDKGTKVIITLKIV